MKKETRHYFFRALLIAVLTFMWSAPVEGTMSGGDFEIYADSFSILSAELVTGGDFTLYDSAGEFSAGDISGGTFELRGGFQAMEKGFISFSSSASTLELGTLSTSAISTGSITITVSTDSETGYSLSMSEDGNLRSGANDINDVSDGTVSIGSEEYGIITGGTDALISSDTAITNGLLIASATGTVSAAATQIDFKAGISSISTAGSYSHQVTFTATVNP